MNILQNLAGAVQVGGALLLSPVLRSGYNHWGASEHEVSQPLPGDELVPTSLMGYTRAISIRAPVERVWAWLVQIGQGRGGLYSYDSLENLAGCKIHSVERIIPKLQNPALGELIRLGPPGYPCFSIMSLDPGRALVLISANPQTGQPVEYSSQVDKGFSIATWQFVLAPQGDHTTRLIVRQRLAYSPDMKWVWRLTEPVGFVMERKMLLGLRQRAERNS